MTKVVLEAENSEAEILLFNPDAARAVKHDNLALSPIASDAAVRIPTGDLATKNHPSLTIHLYVDEPAAKKLLSKHLVDRGRIKGELVTNSGWIALGSTKAVRKGYGQAVRIDPGHYAVEVFWTENLLGFSTREERDKAESERRSALGNDMVRSAFRPVEAILLSVGAAFFLLIYGLTGPRIALAGVPVALLVGLIWNRLAVRSQRYRKARAKLDAYAKEWPALVAILTSKPRLSL